MKHYVFLYNVEDSPVKESFNTKEEALSSIANWKEEWIKELIEDPSSHYKIFRNDPEGFIMGNNEETAFSFLYKHIDQTTTEMMEFPDY